MRMGGAEVGCTTAMSGDPELAPVVLRHMPTSSSRASDIAVARTTSPYKPQCCSCRAMLANDLLTEDTVLDLLGGDPGQLRKGLTMDDLKVGTGSSDLALALVVACTAGGAWQRRPRPLPGLQPTSPWHMCLAGPRPRAALAEEGRPAGSTAHPHLRRVPGGGGRHVHPWRRRRG